MKRKVKKFGKGGDILTGLGAGVIGYHLYDKYMNKDKGKEEKETEAVGGPGRRPRTIEEQTGRKAEPKAESRKDYLEERGAKPIKETGTFTGPDTAEPDLEYKDKVVKPKPAVKKAAPVAQPKNAEPAAPAKPAAPVKKTETEGSAPKDKSGYSLPAKNVTSMIEGQGSSTEPNKSTPKASDDTSKKATKYGIGPYGAFGSIHKAISGYKTPAEVRSEERRKREKKESDVAGMRKGGAVKKYASGGSVSSASKRADGIAQRGKTKGRIC
jgi:hypothetical protein